MDDEYYDCLSIIDNKIRREILSRLVRQPNYPLQLSRELKQSQQSILKHLYAMEKMDIVKCNTIENKIGPPRKIYELNERLTMTIDITPNMFEITTNKIEASENIEEEHEDILNLIKDGSEKDDMSLIYQSIKEINIKLQEIEKERLNLIALKDAAYSFLRKMIEKEDYNYYEKEILYLLTDDVNIGDIAKELKVNESFVEDIFENLKKIIL